MALTIAMLVSSLLGYVALGCAIAAFIPLILLNAVQRRSGTGPWFLAVWLVADVLNLVGIIRLGPQITQIFLAAWYFIADFLMLLQLIFFGHSDWPAPPSKPTSNFLARQKRKNRPFWNRVCEQFISFSVWDDIKLVVSCILAGTAWWGLYLLFSVQKDPDFEIHHKTEISTEAFWLGMAGSATFAAARIPECVSGWRRSARNDKPEHSLDDPLFYILIFENVFNILSIVTLSQDEQYLWHAELPWLLGGKKWKDSPKGQAYNKQEGERQKILDRIEQHKLELKEEWLAEDLREQAGKTIADPVKGKGLVGKYKEKKQKAAKNAQDKVRFDYSDNISNMKPYHNRAEERAKGMHGGLPFAHPHQGSDNSDGPYGSSDDEKAPLSRLEPVGEHRRHSSMPLPSPRSTRNERRAADQSQGEEWHSPYPARSPDNPHGYLSHK